jgi:ABC-type transport system involved in cytochrome bd biosynthesis fused ATPase/permease subunit
VIAIILCAIILCALVIISAQLYHLTRKTKHIMSDIEDLQAANTDLITKADELLVFAASQSASIGTLNQMIADLQAQVASDGSTHAGVQSVIAAMKAETAKMAAALPASTPAPTPATPTV